ncbi:hypothetical protein GCM10010216_10790 [Streptomyces flaveolus]|nr:hypothetical protein GCM10010216_10790 [Streptomyces flaveolus]
MAHASVRLSRPLIRVGTASGAPSLFRGTVPHRGIPVVLAGRLLVPRTPLTGSIGGPGRRIGHRAPPAFWLVASLFVKSRIRCVKVRRRVGHMRIAVSSTGGA